MTNQPTVPGFVPDDPDLPQSVSGDEGDAEAGEGRIVIQDTEVIDATSITPEDVANGDPTPPDEASAAPRRAVDPGDGESAEQ